MNIGLDLDGSLACIDRELSYRMQEAGYENNPDEWTNYLIEENHPEIPVAWIEKQFNDPAFWLNAIPYEDSWFMTNKWFMGNHNVFIITCRPRSIWGITCRWLDEWRINYNDLLCGAEKFKKEEYIGPLDLDIFIEDDPREAEIIGNTIPSILIDRPYNLSYDAKNVTRAKSFYEIDEGIQEWTDDIIAFNAGSDTP